MPPDPTAGLAALRSLAEGHWRSFGGPLGAASQKASMSSRGSSCPLSPLPEESVSHRRRDPSGRSVPMPSDDAQPRTCRIATTPGGSTREGSAATPLDTPSVAARAHLPGLGESREKSEPPPGAPPAFAGCGAPSGGGARRTGGGVALGRNLPREEMGIVWMGQSDARSPKVVSCIATQLVAAARSEALRRGCDTGVA